MPAGNGTGPSGLGSMTGRGLGYCAGYNSPGFTQGPGMGMARGYGRGMGYGRGRGMGYGRGPGYGRGYGAPYGIGVQPNIPQPIIRPPVYSSVDQLTMLKQEKDYLDSELKGLQGAISDIGKRIEEFEKKD